MTSQTSAEEKPCALVDYLVIFLREDQQDAHLCRRYPEEDILGAALPINELLPQANDAANLDPAVSFTVCDNNGVIFFCTKLVIRPDSHIDSEYITVIVSRRPRFKLYQDALIGLKSLVLTGDCVENQLEQLLFEFPASLERVTKVVWDGVGELAVSAPSMRCGFSEVDDYSMNILLDSLDMETVMLCVEALLREENLVVVSQRPQLVAPAVEALRALLHPFQWMGLCVHLLPRDSVHRALSRRGFPILYGMTQTSFQTAKDAFSKHPEVRCFLVSLDEGRAEWILPANSSSAPAPEASKAFTPEMRRMIAEKHTLLGGARVDGVRLSMFQGLLDMLYPYKAFATSWSTSLHSRREAGFDCESFLAQTRVEYFDFLRVLLSTRLFGDFVFRVVNFGSYMSSTIDKLCKAWPQPELNHVARELLMRRYGYTERGARHVWIRVQHLKDDPNLFSSKKFRDFVSTLGLAKEGPPSTGDPALDDIVDRFVRLEILAGRVSEKACPPLLLPTVPRRPKQPSDFFPPHNLYLTSFTSRLPSWLPARDDPVLFSKASARATYFAFCRHPTDDELMTWRSQNSSRPRLHLAFVGGSHELRNAIVSSSSNQSVSGGSDTTTTTVSTTESKTQSVPGDLPKPVTFLACAMKWAQLQGKRSLHDANQLLFQLLMEERHRHREENRRLREVRSSASSTPHHQHNSSTASELQQFSSDPSSTHFGPDGISGSFDLTNVQSNSLAAMEAKVRLLEEKLKEREQEVEALTRQLKSSEPFSASVVRKSEPLFSSRNDRPPSPGSYSVSSTQSSLFTSPVSTPRRHSIEANLPFSAPSASSTGSQVAYPPSSPAYHPTPMLTPGTSQQRVVSPPPYLARTPSFRVISPPPIPSATKSTFAQMDLKRSASTSQFEQTSTPPRGSLGSPPPLYNPPGTPQQQDSARKERNLRVWDSIESGLSKPSSASDGSSNDSKQ